VNADGSEQQNLTDTPASEAAPSGRPTGGGSPSVSPTRGNSEVQVANADGSGQRNLTRNPAVDRGPVWSPAGRRIAFVRNLQVYVMNADGSDQRRLTLNGARNLSPAWSPDGRKIAFERRLGRRHIGDKYREQPGEDPRCGSCARASIFEVYVIDADGSGERRLTRFREPAQTSPSPAGGIKGPAARSSADPLWSPDGRKLAFRSARNGNWELYVMNADGTGQRRLTHTPAEEEGWFAWSPGRA